MELTGLTCPRCGRPADDGDCDPCAQGILWDRDGDAIWEDGPRYCVTCGARRTPRSHRCSADRAIRFYGVTSPFGVFSNFWCAPVRLQGTTYPSVEHWFQSQKFAGSPHADTVRRAPTPATAARFGRSRRHRLRPDWESVKRDVMARGLWAKFTQHPELRAQLLATGDADLVEHTARDAYWGDGGDGSGANWLGRLLVHTRARLRAEPSPTPPLCSGTQPRRRRS